MKQTPITLGILHAQCDRLQKAFPGSRAYADRRLGVDPQYFYIELRDEHAVNPYARYILVEQIDEAVRRVEEDKREMPYAERLARAARVAFVRVTAIMATTGEVEVEANFDGSGEWYTVWVKALPLDRQTREHVAQALCEAGLLNSSRCDDTDAQGKHNAHAVTGFNE